MEDTLLKGVEAALSAHLERTARVATEREASGGCINAGRVIALESGEHFFVKSNPSVPHDFFEKEAEGLLEIIKTETLRAPRPLVADGPTDEQPDCPHFLILEYIEGGNAGKTFAEDMGRGLAAIHRHTAERFGLAGDNYIGATPQSNAQSDSWMDFFREQRLLAQLRFSEQTGLATEEMGHRMGKLVEKLETLIGRREVEASCLHGDLWSGNFMIGASGEPVLIDPAVYYGDREVDLAMTELFGRFDARFYAAYREAYPLDAGYDQRREIYNLYHLMNHLNLFGLSYMGGVMEILRRYT